MRPLSKRQREIRYRHGDSNPGTNPGRPTALTAFWQRLDPPYRSEPVRTTARVYENAIVVELETGERLVLDRREVEGLVGVSARAAA